jgi:hypothetical protein
MELEHGLVVGFWQPIPQEKLIFVFGGLANKGSLTEANTLAIEPLLPIQSCMHPIGYEDGP